MLVYGKYEGPFAKGGVCISTHISIMLNLALGTYDM